jgi:signal transduction histidine kinase
VRETGRVPPLVDNDWTEVVVEDNGTGMPDEVLAKANGH